MSKKKTNRNINFPVLITLTCLLGLILLPQHLAAQELRLVYSNDNLGELAPCG